jgi:hypothetical protein
MDRSYLRSEHEAEAGWIVAALQRVQFTHPHAFIRSAVESAGRDVGFCPQAARHALAWLGLQADTSIGRLRRSEILQLARSIQRFWRQNAGHAAVSPLAVPES